MRVIGIDPGTICCGYGIIESGVRGQGSGVKTQNSRLRTPSSELTYIASGDIRMNPKDPLPQKLKTLYDSLKETLDNYSPSHFCIEKIFYHKSIRSAFALGSTRGIAMLVAAQNSVPVFEYNPTEIKMAITGYGRAEKQQVRNMVIRILNLKSPQSTLSEDGSDALALCICHINNSLINAKIKNQSA